MKQANEPATGQSQWHSLVVVSLAGVADGKLIRNTENGFVSHNHDPSIIRWILAFLSVASPRLLLITSQDSDSDEFRAERDTASTHRQVYKNVTCWAGVTRLEPAGNGSPSRSTVLECALAMTENVRREVHSLAAPPGRGNNNHHHISITRCNPTRIKKKGAFSRIPGRLLVLMCLAKMGSDLGRPSLKIVKGNTQQQRNKRISKRTRCLRMNS